MQSSPRAYTLPLVPSGLGLARPAQEVWPNHNPGMGKAKARGSQPMERTGQSYLCHSYTMTLNHLAPYPWLMRTTRADLPSKARPTQLSSQEGGGGSAIISTQSSSLTGSPATEWRTVTQKSSLHKLSRSARPRHLCKQELHAATQITVTGDRCSYYSELLWLVP